MYQADPWVPAMFQIFLDYFRNLEVVEYVLLY
jgi:hypothetical protein